ncbi:ribonuclease Z [bacterium]|nr:ribonuclease Z [bacterium]
MVKINFLGTGGAVSSAQRDNTSLLLRHQETTLLVDCSGSAIQKLKKLGVEPPNIDFILVTHVHPDHIYGLPSFVHSLMQENCDVKLLASEESLHFCRRLLDLFHLRDRKVKCRIHEQALFSHQTIEITPGLECTPFPVPHHSSSLGFRFKFGDEKKELIYSGDTAVSSSLFQKAHGIDGLIHDCSAPSRFFKKFPSLGSLHTDSLSLGKLSQKAGVERLVPCHFFGELDFSIEEIKEEIQRNYKKKLIIPQDLSRIHL